MAKRQALAGADAPGAHATLAVRHWHCTADSSAPVANRYVAFFWATPGLEAQQVDALSAATAAVSARTKSRLTAQQRKALSVLPDRGLATLASPLMSLERVSWFPVPLRQDDALSEVRRKLAAALGMKDEKQVYVWLEDTALHKLARPPGGPAVAAQEIAAQAMKGRDMITRAELLDCILSLCGDATTRARIAAKYGGRQVNDVLTAWQAVNFTFGVLSAFAASYTTLRPLDFRYTVDGHEVAIRANPFSQGAADGVLIDANLVMGDGTPRHLYSTLSLDGITLESAMGGSLQLGAPVLNACAAHDVVQWARGAGQPWARGAGQPDRERLYFNGFVHQFFPFMPDHTGVGELRLERWRDPGSGSPAPAAILAREAALREWDDLAADVVQRGVASFEEVAWSYAQVRVNEVNANRAVDLLDVFNNFHVSARVPLTILYDGTSTSYKVFTPDVVSRNLSESKIASWIQRKPQQRPDEPYLQMVVQTQVFDGAATYGKIILWPDLSYEIRHNFPSLTGAGDSEFERCIQQVDARVVQPLRQLLAGRPVRLPSPELALSGVRSLNHLNARVNNAVVAMFLRSASARLPGLKAMAAAARTEMAALLDVVHVSPAMLLLRVRRVDSLAHRQTVDEAIRIMQEEPRDAIVAHLVEAFGMTPEEAATQLEEWTTDQSIGLELGHASAFGRARAKRSSVLLLPAAARGGAASRGGAVMVRVYAPLTNIGSKVVVEGVAGMHILPRIQRAVVAMASIAGAWSKRDRKRGARGTRAAEEEAQGAAPSSAQQAAADAADADLDFEEAHQQLESELESLLTARGDGDASSGALPLAQGQGAAAAAAAQEGVGDGDGEEGDGDGDGEGSSSGNKLFLNRLYRADPELFQVKLSSGSRYSSVCGKIDERQPIVITPQEKARIDDVSPGSYNGYVRAGSSPERGERNYFICPEVWCPKSRVSMTMQQFKKNGERCPDRRVEETPVLLDAKYWSGSQRYPGFLEARHHPQGLCMPCCFRRKQHKVKECAAASPQLFASDETDAVSKQPQQAASAPEEGQEANSRYIRGNVFPLGKDMFGLLPPEAHAFFGNRKCGNRDDGSGQIVSQTNCFVRRGIDNTAQPFLAAAAHVLGLEGGHQDLTHRLLQDLDMHAFLQLGEGAVCKEFMPPLPDLRDQAKLAAFTAWLPTQARYLQQFGLRHVAERVGGVAKGAAKARAQALAALVVGDALVCREYVLFDALRKFRAFLADGRAAKTHAAGLLDLVNAQDRTFNPRGINIVLLEADPSGGGSVYVHAGAPTRHRMRPDRPFAFIVKQGPYYEPLYKIHTKKGEMQAEALLSYEGTPAVRAVVNAVAAAGASGSGGTAQVGWGGLQQVLAHLGQRVAGQIIDYRFRAIGLLTADHVAIPLPAPTAVLPDRALGVTYVSEVHRVRPKLAATAVAELLERLATILDDDGFKVQHVVALAGATGRGKKAPTHTHGRVSHFVLRNGFAVPIAMPMASPAALPAAHATPAERAIYLDNLNIVVGLQHADARTSFSNYLKHKSDASERQVRQIVSVLQTRSDLVQEYLFLRSSHNPFPIEHRRLRMYALASTILAAKDSGKGVEDPRIIDRLLHGPDVLQEGREIGVAVHPPPQKPSEFIVVTDTELLQGSLESVLNENIVYTANKQRSTLRGAVLPGAQDAVGTMVLRASGSGERISLMAAAQASQVPTSPLLRGISLRLKRAALTMLHSIDVFAYAAVLNRVFSVASGLSARTAKKIVLNRFIGDAAAKGADVPADLVAHRALGRSRTQKAAFVDVNAGLRQMESDAYDADLYDVRVLCEACGLNVVVIDLAAVGGGKRKQGARTIAYAGREASDRCAVLIRHDGGFDALVGRDADHFLTFSKSKELPGILLRVEEAVDKEAR